MGHLCDYRERVIVTTHWRYTSSFPAQVGPVGAPRKCLPRLPAYTRHTRGESYDKNFLVATKN